MNDALKEIVTRFLGWLDETEGDGHMDTGIVLEYAQEMRDALTPRLLRLTFTHRQGYNACEVPEVCRMYGDKTTRYVEYNPATGAGRIYYDGPGQGRHIEYTGLRQHLAYQRLWSRCLVKSQGWPEGDARAANG